MRSVWMSRGLGDEYKGQGMGMAGQIGDARVSIDNLEVLRVLADRNMIVVKGAVPGSKNSYITIEK